MYDVSKLKTAEQCRTVMERAKARNLNHEYALVFKRYCALVGNQHDDPSDPIIREFYEILGAYEQVLTEKHGRKTAASRTRQKLAKKGVYLSLVEWARGKVETNGFTLLVDRDLAKYTFEYLIAKYAERFPNDVVELVRERLKKHDISLP
jgi:hypothetical protein